MSDLDDAMEDHMAYVVFKEHRPFSYRDFLRFEVEGKEYGMAHGTFRNKVSRLIKAGVVESSYNSCLAFYTLKGIKFVKPMTLIHTGDVVSHSRSHPIITVLRNLPFEKSALHDIHLRFQVRGCWSLLLSASPAYSIHPISKDIHLPALEVGDLRIRMTVHRTDTVSVVVGCSYSPIAVDIGGIIRLSNALTRVEERLSRIIEDCGKYIVPTPAQCQEEISAAIIPDYRSWIVTMWHLGADSSIEYSGEKFSASWEIGEYELIRIYSKEFHSTADKGGIRIKNRGKVRVELQQYPQSTIEQAVTKILDANHSSCR